MTINEISEDLQSQFGKPRNQTEDNIRYVLTLVAEHVEGDHVNENVPKPSLDALATTCYAVMTYGTTPWEELCKKPAIKRTLIWIVVRGKDHYDEVEDANDHLKSRINTNTKLLAHLTRNERHRSFRGDITTEGKEILINTAAYCEMYFALNNIGAEQVRILKQYARSQSTLVNLNAR